MIDSPAEEDKMMWDYCTPGPEALHKEVGHSEDDFHIDL